MNPPSFKKCCKFLYTLSVFYCTVIVLFHLFCSVASGCAYEVHFLVTFSIHEDNPVVYFAFLWTELTFQPSINFDSLFKEG